LRDINAVTGPDQATRLPDYWLLLFTVILVVFGLVMVYSASVAVAVSNKLPQNYYFLRELLFAGIGFLVLIGLNSVNYRQFGSVAFGGWFLACILLALVLVPRFGTTVSGAQRWIHVGAITNIQPSELAKIALALLLAQRMAEGDEVIRTFKGSLYRFVLPTVIPALLVIKEPDLGTAVVIAVIGVSMYLTAGARLWQIPALCGVLAGAFAVFVRVAPYRMERVNVFRDMFFNPWNQSTHDAYHVQQAVLALGSGGMFGRGLGSGRQRFGYLPAPHTDSIFAIIGEELGLLGCTVVIVLFVLIAWRGLRIARQSPDRFGSLLATGLTINLVLQAFINIAVVSDSIPFTGVPLPFISFGGSSLLVSLAGVGILLSISRCSAVMPHIVPSRAPALTQGSRRRPGSPALAPQLSRAPEVAGSAAAYAAIVSARIGPQTVKRRRDVGAPSPTKRKIPVRAAALIDP
jgi:cell division protein FtsW